MDYNNFDASLVRTSRSEEPYRSVLEALLLKFLIRQQHSWSSSFPQVHATSWNVATRAPSQEPGPPAQSTQSTQALSQKRISAFSMPSEVSEEGFCHGMAKDYVAPPAHQFNIKPY